MFFELLSPFLEHKNNRPHEYAIYKIYVLIITNPRILQSRLLLINTYTSTFLPYISRILRLL
jgi:hypothetical protein